MEERSNEKEQYDDLTSLFLPDILHPIASDNTAVKHEEMEHSNDLNSLLVPPIENSNNQDSNSNYNNFMNNNNFINNALLQHANVSNGGHGNGGHISHYANFVPIEAAASVQQHSQHHQNRMFPLNSQYPLFPSSNMNPQTSIPNMKMNSPPNNDLWFSNQPNGYGGVDPHPQNSSGNFNGNEFENFNFASGQFNNQTPFGNIYKNSSPSVTGDVASDTLTAKMKAKDKDNSKSKKASKPKKSKTTPPPHLNIDYKSHKLTKLLDLKRTDNTLNDYKIIDKDNNDVEIQFQSFLNGRFFTNDTDNNNFILSKLENEKSGNKESDANLKDHNVKNDPKVISCYRRNYIQVSMNLNLMGLSDESESNKVLKLQTNEYGYSITRVIKWFKVEVFANTNVSSVRNVPIVIYDDKKEKEKEKERDAFRDEVDANVTDIINPISITNSQATITLNNSNIKDSEIDNYYTIKKLQFKNATPNNGNLTFQNYYHLKIKVSAVVADLYYDDYIDEDYSNTNTDNNRNEVNLFELVSEPIIVRGRNPSFYAERKDILVKGRSSNSKDSFKLAGQVIEDKDLKVNGKINDTENIRRGGEGVNEGEMDRENEEADEIGEKGDNDDEEDDEEEEEDDDEEEEEGTDESSVETANKRRRSNSPSKYLPYNNQQDKSIPPLLYNATSSSRINLKSMLDNSSSKLNLIPLNKASHNYKYFPISNVYYLPPINAVYFPHGAHQQVDKESDNNSRSSSIEKEATKLTNDSSPQRRKNSKVYFR